VFLPRLRPRVDRASTHPRPNDGVCRGLPALRPSSQAVRGDRQSPDVGAELNLAPLDTFWPFPCYIHRTSRACPSHPRARFCHARDRTCHAGAWSHASRAAVAWAGCARRCAAGALVGMAGADARTGCDLDCRRGGLWRVAGAVPSRLIRWPSALGVRACGRCHVENTSRALAVAFRAYHGRAPRGCRRQGWRIRDDGARSATPHTWRIEGRSIGSTNDDPR